MHSYRVLKGVEATLFITVRSTRERLFVKRVSYIRSYDSRDKRLMYQEETLDGQKIYAVYVEILGSPVEMLYKVEFISYSKMHDFLDVFCKWLGGDAPADVKR